MFVKLNIFKIMIYYHYIMFRYNQMCVLYSKTGKQNDPNNYRPICLTSHVAKLFERIVKDRLVSFCDQYYLWILTLFPNWLFLPNKSLGMLEWFDIKIDSELVLYVLTLAMLLTQCFDS